MKSLKVLMLNGSPHTNGNTAVALREQVQLYGDQISINLPAVAQQAEAGQGLDCALFDGETRALIDCLPHLPGKIILVSNEVGCGIVPMNAISRLFADEQGRLNQRVAAVCERVTLVAAGLPLELKR